MGRKAHELSALEVARLKKPGLHAVGGVAGLHMQINQNTARSWILRAMVGTKRRDMGLGGFPDVTLAGAREKAREARLKIEHGVDPILARQQADSALKAIQARAITFDEAARLFIDSRSDEWRNPKHRAQWSATLATYASPVIGKLLVSDIDQSHVLAVLEPIWKTKTETASRLRGRIESVLNWATSRGQREGLNPARWKGHLENLLSKPSKITKVDHHTALAIDAVGSFMADAGTRAGMAAPALMFLVLTAARSGEVRGATWAEFDLTAGVWTIPGDRMKSGKEHRVPLSAWALRIVRDQLRIEDTELVFPAPRGGMLSDMTLTALMRRMGLAAVPHGFRSTFRDWCAERTNYSRELAEQALAHALENKVEAAYRRGDMLEKRRHMMEAWAAHCERVAPATGEVIALRKAS